MNRFCAINNNNPNIRISKKNKVQKGHCQQCWDDGLGLRKHRTEDCNDEKRRAAVARKAKEQERNAGNKPKDTAMHSKFKVMWERYKRADIKKNCLAYWNALYMKLYETEVHERKKR